MCARAAAPYAYRDNQHTRWSVLRVPPGAPQHTSHNAQAERAQRRPVYLPASRFRMCSLRVLARQSRSTNTLMASFACPTPSPQPHCKRHVGALRIAIRCAHNRVPDEWIRHHIKSKSHSALRGLRRQPAIALQNIGTLALTSSLAAPPDLLTTPCICTPFT